MSLKIATWCFNSYLQIKQWTFAPIQKWSQWELPSLLLLQDHAICWSHLPHQPLCLTNSATPKWFLSTVIRCVFAFTSAWERLAWINGRVWRKRRNNREAEEGKVCFPLPQSHAFYVTLFVLFPTKALGPRLKRGSVRFRGAHIFANTTSPKFHPLRKITPT